MADKEMGAAPQEHIEETGPEQSHVHTVAAHTFAEKAPENHDDALDFLRATDEGFTYTDKEARRVKWKIDLILMPMLLITNLLGFLDKAVLSQAAVWGLLDDAHLKGQQYSWVVTLFYFG